MHTVSSLVTDFDGFDRDCSDVWLTVHLSIILVINQYNAQILVLYEVYYMPLHVSNTTRSVPKVMRMIFKKLLNIHAITVYPLQNRLLVIEYSDSTVAATLHSSGGSLHFRCCSKPSSQLSGRFQLSQNDVI